VPAGDLSDVDAFGHPVIHAMHGRSLGGSGENLAGPPSASWMNYWSKPLPRYTFHQRLRGGGAMIKIHADGLYSGKFIAARPGLYAPRESRAASMFFKSDGNGGANGASVTCLTHLSR
jgi:hypothetical protein